MLAEVLPVLGFLAYQRQVPSDKAQRFGQQNEPYWDFGSPMVDHHLHLTLGQFADIGADACKRVSVIRLAAEKALWFFLSDWFQIQNFLPCLFL